MLGFTHLINVQHHAHEGMYKGIKIYVFLFERFNLTPILLNYTHISTKGNTLLWYACLDLKKKDFIVLGMRLNIHNTHEYTLLFKTIYSVFVFRQWLQLKVCSCFLTYRTKTLCHNSIKTIWYKSNPLFLKLELFFPKIYWALSHNPTFIA